MYSISPTTLSLLNLIHEGLPTLHCPVVRHIVFLLGIFMVSMFPIAARTNICFLDENVVFWAVWAVRLVCRTVGTAFGGFELFAAIVGHRTVVKSAVLSHFLASRSRFKGLWSVKSR